MADENNVDFSDDGGNGLKPPAPEPDEEGGGAPEWMATFADLVTLLMCFFVLLFAMSTTQQETFKELVKSMRSALGVQQIPEAGTREGLRMNESPPEPRKAESEPVDELGAMVQKEVDEIVSDVRELIMFNRLGGMVKVQETDLGPIITLSDLVLFEAGATEMSEEGLYIMAQIAGILKQFAYQIRILGHTDGSPIRSTTYSNWELSSIRASKVVRYLVKQGIDPRLLSAVGFAEYRPIDTNDTEAGRAQNRRVEIVYERDDIYKTIVKKKK